MTAYTAEQQEWLANIAAQIDEAMVGQDPSVGLPPGTRLSGTPGGHWRTPQDRVATLIRPGETLTQYGTTSAFREVPRFQPEVAEVEVSMMLGKRDVDFVAWKVLRRPAKPISRVRYFRTSDLWLHGYIPGLTPTEHNRFHVSIYYGALVGLEHLDQAAANWSDPNRVTLEAIAISAGEAI